MGYYSKEDIENIKSKYKDSIRGTKFEAEKESDFIKRMASQIAIVLDRDPSMYVTFGIYWYRVKDVLRLQNKDKWYSGEYKDLFQYNKGFEVDYFTTMLCATAYSMNSDFIVNSCWYINEDEEYIKQDLEDMDYARRDKR